MQSTLKNRLDELYHIYNHREYVHPDPLEFLYDYPDAADREIAGLIASSLAYGRVGQILKSVSYVLNMMTPSPEVFLKNASMTSLRKAFIGFRHRFANGETLSALLTGTKNVLETYGSLYECFLSGFRKEDDTVLPAMTAFTRNLTRNGRYDPGHLLALPERGSACKRMNLFLRWMVRKDEVDPGGWETVSPSSLIIPLDTHMHRICLHMGLTRRKQADMRTALEITSAFKAIVPDDPVRYDFALTRLGIREDAEDYGLIY